MRSPAWAASGWLVTTIPRRAITSDRLCASQPSARSPRTALQNAGFGVAAHDAIVSAGADCPWTTMATARVASAMLAMAGTAVLARVIAPRPPRAAVGNREAAVVVRGQLDPRAPIERAELEIGNERIRKVFRTV